MRPNPLANASIRTVVAPCVDAIMWVEYTAERREAGNRPSLLLFVSTIAEFVVAVGVGVAVVADAVAGFCFASDEWENKPLKNVISLTDVVL